MKSNQDSSMAMRGLKAVAVVLAILVMAPGVEAITRIVVPTQIAEANVGGIDASELLVGADANAALGRIEGMLAESGPEAPAWFREEIGFLPGARDVRVSGDGDIIGYVVPGYAHDVFERLVENMEAAGWASVPLGGVEGATFVKSAGTCTWTLCTCTQVGSDTSVVVRCMHS